MHDRLAGEAIDRCRLLASFSDEPGFTTRTFLSESMRKVHAEVSAWMMRAGMTVDTDAVGNLRGLYAGPSPGARRLLIGSHLDTVPHAGAFDGILGVMMGIALVEALHGRTLPFAIEVVGFSEEEGVRFGVPFIGSRALVGTVDAPLLATKDAAGTSVRDAIGRFGLEVARLQEARPAGNPLGYLEFHIEQGPVLDNLRQPLAIVDRIVGRTQADAMFVGMAGHAGTTPMDARKDALTAAAEWITGVEAYGRHTPGLVTTTGLAEAQPAAANVIAGKCRVSLDVRHADDAVRTAAVYQLRTSAHVIAKRRGLTVEWTPRFDHAAVAMDAALIGMLERAVERSGATPGIVSSGAGHDAMILAATMPAAMLFIRSPGGVSHHPDESVIDSDVALALAAGGHFLDEMAASIDG